MEKVAPACSKPPRILRRHMTGVTRMKPQVVTFEYHGILQTKQKLDCGDVDFKYERSRITAG
jgi:hypothetical protein